MGISPINLPWTWPCIFGCKIWKGGQLPVGRQEGGQAGGQTDGHSHIQQNRVCTQEGSCWPGVCSSLCVLLFRSRCRISSSLSSPVCGCAPSAPVPRFLCWLWNMPDWPSCWMGLCQQSHWLSGLGACCRARCYAAVSSISCSSYGYSQDPGAEPKAGFPKYPFTFLPGNLPPAPGFPRC